MLIQHKNHDVFTNTQNKVALDRDDDKRITQDDQITTLARGYLS